MEDSRLYLLYKPNYSQFCVKIPQLKWYCYSYNCYRVTVDSICIVAIDGLTDNAG